MMSKIEKPDKQNCLESLEVIGMLSHAWQDYYAHAIHIDSDGSSKTIGKITGNPREPGENMKPASFGRWYWNWGEHGGTEPGRRAPDTEDRLSKAESYTSIQYNDFLPRWWEACECYAKEVFK